MNERYSRQKDTVPMDRLEKIKVTVIGIGAIGRNVALQLTAMGVQNLQLIDFDTVEESNIASQGYYETDLGSSKVESTAKVCKSINKHVNIETINGKYARAISTGSVVFACVDNMDARKFIWNSINKKALFYIDGRMAAEALRVICANVNDSESYKYYLTTLFTQAEAYQGSCTAKSTIYCSNIAAGFLVATFAKWLRDVPLDRDIMVNLLTNEINQYKEKSND